MDKRTSHPDDSASLPPELAALARRIAEQPVPRPSFDATTRLVEQLLVLEPRPAPAAHVNVFSLRRASRTLRVAGWHLRLLGPAFWCVGVVSLLMAGALSPSGLGGHPSALPLVLCAPLTAALGIAFAVRTTSRGLREVEASAPLSFAELSAGLALALVVFDALLCLVVSAGLALLGVAPFAALVAAWLGPLLLLAGISLPVALRFGVRAAALVGAGPWLLVALLSLFAPLSPIAALYSASADPAAILPRLLAAAVGILLLALPLLRGEVWLVGARQASIE